jgi:hypothetical protein
MICRSRRRERLAAFNPKHVLETTAGTGVLTRTMRSILMRTIAFLLTAMFASMLTAPDVVAQRGGQHLNSPGYQRALAESRKPKAAPVEPATIRNKRPQRARMQ